MSKHTRDIKLLRQNDNDLMVQYLANGAAVGAASETIPVSVVVVREKRF